MHEYDRRPVALLKPVDIDSIDGCGIGRERKWEGDQAEGGEAIHGGFPG
jgi:hypothetical protein